jgi:flagellar basal-body rod modification protein FlgD
MQIPGISSLDPTPGSLGNQLGTQELGRDAFLELFVAQLENQDPLDPVQNEEFVAQLATFSSLEQLEEMNDNIVAMIALNQSNALLSQLTQSGDLIGKSVSWEDPSTGLSSSGVVDKVKILEGLAVLRVGGQDVPLALVTGVEDTGAQVDVEETQEDGE